MFLFCWIKWFILRISVLFNFIDFVQSMNNYKSKMIIRNNEIRAKYFNEKECTHGRLDDNFIANKRIVRYAVPLIDSTALFNNIAVYSQLKKVYYIINY